jgi:fructoselysine 6-kinase
MDLVSFSAITQDFYPQFNFYSPGGNSLNYAINFKKCASDSVAIVGAVGKDDVGSFVLEKLVKNKIDVSNIHRIDEITAQNHLRVDEKGERFGIEGTWKGGAFEKYIFTDHDWQVINKFDYAATTAYDPQFQVATKRLKKNINLSVDFLHLGDFSLLEKFNEVVTLAFFEGKEEFFPFARKTALKFPAIPIVVTLGAKGSKAFLGSDEFFQSAPTVDKVVDTTGCGDSYQANFSYSWFIHRDIELAMKNGTEAAGRTLSHLGGIE